MIDIRNYNDTQLKDFEDKASRSFYPKGSVFLYHEGNFGDEVGRTKLGAMMQRIVGYEINDNMSESSRVKFKPNRTIELFQKKLGTDLYAYYAVIK